MENTQILLTVSGLWKSYAAPVLLDVALDLRRGEVHALVGENGAGKTTLARILAGLTRPDRGAMTLRGRPYAPASKHDADQVGIRMVMQELHLVANLTVAENLFLGRLPSRFGVVSYRRLRADARAVMARVGLGDVAPDRPVRDLGVGQQQLVEIAAGLSGRCDLLILDEPTAALTDTEVALLFARIRELKAAGAAILYISHRMEEIQRIADRITVLRDGRVVGTRRASEASLDEIIRMMVGRDLGEARPRAGARAARVALRVVGLARGKAVRNVTLEAREGEILGIAGLMGSGRTETLRAIFGADRPDAGHVYLYGSEAPARIRSPRDAVRLGIALLTEDRKQQGLLLPLPIRHNVTLARLRDVAWLGAVLRPAAERAVTERLARALDLQCRSADQPVAELSGGNQQKVVIARWLYRDCRIALFDEPTRGIDVGAKFEIYRLLADLAERGKAIVVVSSDLLELMSICDRIAVMSAGRLVATFARGEWTQDKIMEAALRDYLKTHSGSALGAGAS
ncbi:MAG TPA: sugar ABC transporter ATP-binding protein [Planctomycetota bacterium]|nr:sugar ABC transporter ATP-binding protein [Planctomycetota bacterium]